MQQHMEVVDIVHMHKITNMETQHMKQQNGIQTARSLWALLSLSSGVGAAVTMLLLPQAYSTPTTTVGGSGSLSGFRVGLAL